MKLKTIATFLTAAGMSVGGAYLASDWIEVRSGEMVRAAVESGGANWAEVSTNGLLVMLDGTAPDEATRFRLITAVGRVVDPDRIVDQMGVAAIEAIRPPNFVIEILRNGDGVSLIGLVPTDTGSEAVTRQIEGLSETGKVTNMLDTAAFPVPENWDAALEFAIEALQTLPRSKISVTANKVSIKAISDSAQAKQQIEANLMRRKPKNIRLVMDIGAPRPVITPFTLRMTLHDGALQFDACSAFDRISRNQILKAARDAGADGVLDCAIGLGVPSPKWADAVATAIKSLGDIGGGSLTFSDADVTLVALDTTSQATFDRVIGELDANLPEVFSLHGVLPKKVVVDGTGQGEGVVEFVATRSPEGLVQLRGRLNDDKIEQIVGSYARAQFGSEAVYLATRDDPDLPSNWAIRVLASLEALATLQSGSAVVQPEYVEIRGISGVKNASAEISRLLGDKLGESSNFKIDVRYDELLDPTLNIPSPQECVDRINKILALSKIVFEPSSAEITQAAGGTIDKIGEIVKLCNRVQMEIGGHTDSQGREVMNQTLSQQRAESVLSALLQRRILTRALTARGYGEAVPIADNKTEAGREVNRRIEFKLISDARTAPDGDTAADGGTQGDAGDDASSGENNGGAPEGSQTQGTDGAREQN